MHTRGLACETSGGDRADAHRGVWPARLVGGGAELIYTRGMAYETRERELMHTRGLACETREGGANAHWRVWPARLGRGDRANALTDFPLIHSVARELEAIADPQPNVLNLASTILPSSSTLIYIMHSYVITVNV